MKTRTRVRYAFFIALLLVHVYAFADIGKGLDAAVKGVAAVGVLKKDNKLAQDACAVSNTKTSGMIKQVVKDLEKKCNQTPTCFDPETDPDIQKYFYPNLISSETACDLHETKESMSRMHQMILKRSKELDLDPRLVYIRMLGEAGGDPFMVQNSKDHICKKPDELVAPKSGFGMFQFTGGPYAADSIILLKENEKLPLKDRLGIREAQVKYYLDVYVNKFRNAAKYTKCKKPLKDFSDIEKLAYLGIGACKETVRARKTVTSNYGYVNSGATRIFNDMEKKVPLCK